MLHEIATGIMGAWLAITSPSNLPNDIERVPKIEHTVKENKVRNRVFNKFIKRCGRASWYGNESRGRKTANGERFNPGGLTAATRSDRFGTRLYVINPQNGRSVIVRVNDRGPSRRHKRVIDLSQAAFSKIAKLSTGVTSVCIIELRKENVRPERKEKKILRKKAQGSKPNSKRVVER